MKRNRSQTRWSLVITVILATVLTYIGFTYFAPRAQPAPIFVINPVSLEYGDTTISGILRKDSPIGVTGNYLLILDDSRPVLLDAQELDPLLGHSVAVTGYLTPADGDLPMKMAVNSLSTN